jgi:hypothetical protein
MGTLAFDQTSFFHVGATFKMRTYRILLLIDNMIMHDKVYICNQMEWGESKTAERQRKREAERQSFAENERWHRQ